MMEGRSTGPAEAPEGALVCVEPPAQAVGQRILERGGNAVDAAIAAAFAQGVVNPMMCGLGGTGELNVFWAESDEHLIIQAMGGASEKARPDCFEYVGETPRAGRWRVKDNANYIGYKASIVPTFVRVAGEAHRLFGRLPWQELIEPAIDLAQDGYEVWPWLTGRWDPHALGALDWPSGRETLNGTEECARIYLKIGDFYKAGDRLLQQDYANTLRLIAEKGADVFYEGEVGQAIAQDFAAHDGLLTSRDLLRCRPLLSLPSRTTYRGYTLYGRGAIRLEIYNILEGFDLRSLGHGSPRCLDTLARAIQIAHIDRARYIADPRFADVPTQMLISKQHAAGLRHLIQSGEDIRDVEPGWVPSFGTTALVAMDGEGNAVAMKQSNGNSSGVVIPGLGFLFNNHMHNFNPRPGHRNSIAPGKFPEAADGPLVVCKDGKPFLCVSHYSKAGISGEIQVVLNIIDFGMPVQEAVSAPRIHAEYRQRTVYVDPDFPGELVAALEALGTQKVVVTPISPAESAVHKDPVTGRILAGHDPRGDRPLSAGP